MTPSKMVSGNNPGLSDPRSRPWVLRSASGSSISRHDMPAAFIASLRQAMTEAKDIERLYDLWEQNVDTLRTLQRYSKEESGIVTKLVAHLRLCAVGLVKQAGASQASQKESVARSDDPVARRIIDKSTLAISEAKRIRCKEHLRYVASQPCVICGRSPSHAHHVKYAQRRGLGIKVSDEFAVPLCATHHHQLHNTTKEREWWQERKIDPLMIAGTLWRESQKRGPDTAEAVTKEPIHYVSDSSAAPTGSSTP